MKIALLDHENNRVIVAEIPKFLLTDKTKNDHDIADAILSALGISSGNVDWMIGDFAALQRLDLTQDFKRDALAALKESSE